MVTWLVAKIENDDIFVDYNGKPKKKYIIELPYWMCRAMAHGSFLKVRIEFRDKYTSMRDQIAEEEPHKEYFEKHWSKRITKMRKLNHNYMQVSVLAKSTKGFASMEDYNAYHRELRELNKKYQKEVTTPASSQQ